jgi:hypothetical protein
MEFDFILHVIGIAGTRMIQQGTYGLSRGEENGLATCGLSLGGMVRLYLSARERSPGLEEWILGWWNTGRNLEVLKPRYWFTAAHDPGDFGWFPAPAAADAIIDQFCEALHKRPHCFHVFAKPFLMTNRWRKTLLKALDVYFVLKPVCDIWDNSQHEPLDIFISLPLSRHEPWCLRHTQPVVDLARSLREVPDADFLQKGHLLCEFIYWTRQLETMPDGMVRRFLHPIKGGLLPGKIAQGRGG